MQIQTEKMPQNNKNSMRTIQPAETEWALWCSKEYVKSNGENKYSRTNRRRKEKPNKAVRMKAVKIQKSSIQRVCASGWHGRVKIAYQNLYGSAKENHNHQHKAETCEIGALTNLPSRQGLKVLSLAFRIDGRCQKSQQGASRVRLYRLQKFVRLMLRKLDTRKIYTVSVAWL